MYFSTRILLLAFATTSFFSSSVSAGCPAPIAVTSRNCIRISSYADFKKEAESIGSSETKCFEPFTVSKSSGADPTLLEGRDVRLACKVPGSCRISGPGTHVRILGSTTSATLQGFYFSGADDNAVQVHKGAGSRNGSEQNICDCRFEGNDSNNKGAAIKFMENSESYVEDCDFRNNESKAAGGAVFVTGAKVEMVSSYFAGNVAQVGGAISVEHDDQYKSEFTMSRCDFADNIARGRGPAVYIDSRTGRDPYTDEGGNAGVDNSLPKGANARGSSWDCNGICHLTKKECDKFKSDDVDIRPAFGKGEDIEEDTTSGTIAKPNDDVWLNKPTAPKPTAPRPTAPKPTAPKPTAPKPTQPAFRPTNRPPFDSTSIRAATVPSNPESGYFNFDPSNNARYGPDNWSKVSAKSTDEYRYWKEYDEYLKPDLSKNYCGATNKFKKRASPIDLNEKAINDVCLEYHEIRDKPGSFSLEDSRVDVNILKDKLQIIWPESGWWDNIRGPNADIPKGWGHHYPVTHADFIMPSAHTLEGKRFAAEYQIWLMTDRGRGTPVVSMLVDIDPDERDNWYFQIAIDAWQDEFDDNHDDCRRKERGLRSVDREKVLRRLLAPVPPEGEEEFTDYDLMDLFEENERSDAGDGDERKLQSRAWNPFHPNMMRSIWFWGYEGSTLTPPCYPFVEWRVIDKPMTISTKQHNQLKKILFGNVDKNCQPTSVHASGGIASPPVVRDNGQSLHKCDCFDFLSDAFRRQNPRIRDCSDFKRNDRPSWATDTGK
mmetsp:Transcript_33876/g.73427  ORF Transcript_33876/g.73427 Transcript_33876/m.73427 type:complete len:772 (+) Transcript_33876:249-2564(+)